MLVGFVLGCIFSAFAWFFLRNVRAGNNFLTRPALIGTAGLALLFLVVSVLIEHLVINEETYTSFLTDPKTWVMVSKEFFFASVIALFFMTTIELYSRSEQEEFFKEATSEAQKSVFQAVYQSKADQKVFEEVEESIFKQSFVRTSHSRDIHLRRLSNSDEYILLTSTQEFRIKNITKFAQEYEPVVYLPRSLEKFDDYVKVNRVTIYKVKDGTRSDLLFESTSQDEAIQKAIKPNLASPSEICYHFECHSVDPDDEIEVQYELTLVKEKYDNEIWTTLIPTLKAEVTVQSEVEGLNLQAIAHHRGTMMPSSQGNSKFRKWTVERPLLPYQGYVVTWSEAE